jgi:hypothetical protein
MTGCVPMVCATRSGQQEGEEHGQGGQDECTKDRAEEVESGAKIDPGAGGIDAGGDAQRHVADAGDTLAAHGGLGRDIRRAAKAVEIAFHDRGFAEAQIAAK